jgi:hypothetical protein
MIGLDSSSCVRFSHILRHLLLHSHPPEILLQVLIHFVGSQMDGIARAMSFIHDLAMKFNIF